MKQSVIIFVLLIWMGCTPDANEGGNLDCMSSTEAEFIAEAVTTFEGALKVVYKEDNMESMYGKFLSDFSEMRFPPQFYVNQKTMEVILPINEQGYYDYFWMSPSAEDDEEFILYIDTESKWFKCLTKNSTSEDLKSIYSTMAETPDMSPGLLAGGFREALKTSELDHNTKSVIALSLFYTFGLTLILNSED